MPGTFPEYAAVLTLVAVMAGGCASRQADRAPAAFKEISDSEIPAATIYSEATAPSDKPDRPSNVMITPIKPAPVVSKAEIERRTGKLVVRGRAVSIDSDRLLEILSSRPVGEELDLQIGLFENVRPVIRFKVPSGYDVNRGLNSGFAVNDPASSAQISVEAAEEGRMGLVNGRLRYQGTDYLILPDPERRVHYILEMR